MEISILISVLWAIISLLVMIQYEPVCKDLNWKDQLIVGIIFIIGGPIFVVANILEAILGCILSKGQGDNDGP